MKILSKQRAVQMGFSADRRRRRREHRQAARKLLREGGILNNFSAPGSTLHAVAQWHLAQARWLSR